MAIKRFWHIQSQAPALAAFKGEAINWGGKDWYMRYVMGGKPAWHRCNPDHTPKEKRQWIERDQVDFLLGKA